MKISPVQEKAISRVVERELTARGYDNYPVDQELYQEAIDDVTNAIVNLLSKGEDDDTGD